jgi:hypothetical protein
MSHTTTTESNPYGSSWIGPPWDNFTVAGLSAAIAALTAAIGTSVETLPDYTNYRYRRQSLSLGAIVGISLAGGAVLIFTITAATVRVFRRRLQESILRFRLAPTKPLDISGMEVRRDSISLSHRSLTVTRMRRFKTLKHV